MWLEDSVYCEGWTEDGEHWHWRGQQRSGYAGLGPTHSSRGLRAGAPLLPLHLPFPALLSLFLPSLSPLTFGHLAQRTTGLLRRTSTVQGEAQVQSCPALEQLWPLSEVFCFPATMREEFTSHRRLWISGIEALLLSVVHTHFGLGFPIWLPHRRVGSGQCGARTEGN